ncbi:TadE/TadG family type IV pilus assembly protein [Sulfitobacter sp. D35]|uniref:TadE/TadG family type IV pilus assembly protein n=1 Tax=Sulfitobacter sp. D35 TaxID=3083252 RepID=UPI00296F6E92|nr:TadE/TadG family type IV pilus assembly protein [Sulfitobacter sp. D35]MDW4497018.1 TadE/TadG family type IV pilus assembly protein [Sulfitobacter sp. D35]
MKRSQITRERRSPSAGSAGKFLWDENGSFSVEAVIWTPILAIILAVVMNISMVFHAKSQILRVVQDANRAVSLNRLNGETAVQDYINTNLAYLGASLDISSSVDSATNIVTTTVHANATDLMPLTFMTSKFSSVKVGVASHHIIEF